MHITGMLGQGYKVDHISERAMGVKMFDICLFGHFDTGPAVATVEVYKRVVL